jgi:V/A-type H+-transporting ATPase subunit I
VAEAVYSVTKTVHVEFSELTDTDNPPTLMKNNRLIENFEGLTNTYSAPNYREFDPNTVMAFFYSLFMGFIIGDAGYGLLMAICGWFIWYKNRENPTGMSRLAAVFAVGGLFAIFWGGLFNSLFGFQVLPKTLMPDPQKDQWSLMGIKVPSVLLIALEIGVFQLFVGYICKAVQEWRRGNILDGICDGIVWAIFSIGVALAIVGFIDEANLPALGTVGGIIAGVSLLIAIVTAGRYEKFFGKFTKGFGTAYGIINYASDILSYARLYGLMLSGAVIAQIISTYGGQFVTSGNIALIALGIVLFIVGHGFNLVMNLLGAYIHDARLQYVEFYGRFFEGEGELFAPLGSEKRYIRVINK